MERQPFNASAFISSAEATAKYQTKYIKLFEPGQKVLDIGCGAGVFLEMLNAKHIMGIGVDDSETAIEECRRKNLEVHQADVFKFLSAHRDEFHGAFCSHFVEHFQPHAVLELFSNVQVALKPRGLFIIQTPNFKNIMVSSENFWLDISHVRPYPVPLLEKMLEWAGFSILQSGIDKDTTQRMPKRKPWLAPAYIMKKIRFGEYFGKGDGFVVAQKTEA